MVTKRANLTPAETLDQHIREHRAWVKQWREEHGDPQEALGEFLIERFGIEALQATYEEYLRHEDSFLFDDYDDEDDEEVNGRQSD